MTDSIYLFTGVEYTTKSLELTLGTEDDLVLLTPGSEMGTPEHENTWHVSQWANGEKLVRHRVKNRTWPVKLLAGDTDSATPADDLADALVALELLIKQARRSHIQGDVDHVGLYIKLDGATNPTYFTVVDMECNGMSLLEELSRIRKDARVSFTLITESFGYGDEETIENWILTPHFQEDGNADGLADNWIETGTPATTLDTAVYLCGSQSQKVVTDNAGTDGLNSDTIACTAYQGDDFAAYAWISVSGDPINFGVVGDVTGGIDSVRTDGVGTPVLDTKTMDGTAWIKIGFIGTVGGADTTLTIVVERQAGTQITTFYVDKCYLQFGVSAIPTAWCSQNTLYQHSDSDAGKVCYLDVADVPGDVEAETEFGLYGNNVIIGYAYIGRRSSSEAQAAGGFYQQLPEVGDTNYAADAARINDGKWTSTPTSAWAALTELFKIKEPLLNALAPKYRVLVSVNDANGASATDGERSDWKLEYYVGQNAVFSQIVKFSQHDLSTRWTWIDLGTFDLSRQDLRRHRASMLSTDDIAYFRLFCKRDTGAHAVSCDDIIFMPVENDAFCIFSAAGSVATGYWYAGNIDSDLDYLNWSSAWQYNVMTDMGGSIPRLYPMAFHRFDTLICTTVISGVYYKSISVPANYCKVQLAYRPRAKFLFGS